MRVLSTKSQIMDLNTDSVSMSDAVVYMCVGVSADGRRETVDSQRCRQFHLQHASPQMCRES